MAGPTEVEVIDDGVIAPLVSVKPEEELQLGKGSKKPWKSCEQAQE